MEKYVRKEISADTARSYGQGQLVPILIPVSPADDDDADGTDDDDDDDDDDQDDGDDNFNRICCYQLRLSAVFSLHLFVNI